MKLAFIIKDMSMFMENSKDSFNGKIVNNNTQKISVNISLMIQRLNYSVYLKRY
jgi:hypothetical protein